MLQQFVKSVPDFNDETADPTALAAIGRRELLEHKRKLT